MSIKHVVVLHGYSLAEHPKFRDVVKRKDGSYAFGKFGDWEHVCVRCDKHLITTGTVHVYGRIPMAIALADVLNAEQIIFTTGATWSLDGKSEAAYHFELFN